MSAMAFKHSKYILLAVVAGLVVGLDQITKAAVQARIPLYATIPVIPGFFDLTHIQNPGGAFGFLAGQASGTRHLLFIGFAILAVVFILWFYHQLPERASSLGAGLSLILGGALGNLIDRFRYGQVVDFIDLYIGDMHWPAFNVADSAVTVGTAIFAYHVLIKRTEF